MRYYEIIINCNRRPSHPEDNTIILKANDMQEALKMYHENTGNFLAQGEILNCRLINYVFEFKLIK